MKAAAGATPVSWAAARERFAQPAFASVAAVLARLDTPHWPTLDMLNALAAGIVNRRGAALRFAGPALAEDVQHYETRIANEGVVTTRENWHDLFNALAWIAFPRGKAVISQMHAEFLGTRGIAEARARSVERDVLTLFDEGGAIVASEDPSLLDVLRNFGWGELFVTRRADVHEHMRVYLFGHALLEKMLTPYVGITAKAACIAVPQGWAGAPVQTQIADLDARIAARFVDPEQLRSTRLLAPFPLLGMPGWFAANEAPSFYANAAYFRSGYARPGRARSPRRVQ